MDLRKNLTPALLSYDGIQYTYMAPVVFEDGQYDYVQEHLRILSGFYGVVKPMDGVVPYRLEMQAKVAVARYKNLYDFWGYSLYQEVADDSRVIVNLASKEYSKCVEKYLQPGDRYITCIFGELEGGDETVQPRLYQVRETIRTAIPDAEERISWQMPTFWQGRNIIHFAAFKKHIGIYPGGEVTEMFAEKLAGYDTSKGTIRLPHNKELPLELIVEIAQWAYKRNAK